MVLHQHSLDMMVVVVLDNQCCRIRRNYHNIIGRRNQWDSKCTHHRPVLQYNHMNQ